MAGNMRAKITTRLSGGNNDEADVKVFTSMVIKGLFDLREDVPW